MDRVEVSCAGAAVGAVRYGDGGGHGPVHEGGGGSHGVGGGGKDGCGAVVFVGWGPGWHGIYCMRCARKNERERAGRGAARVTCRQKLKDMAIPNDIFLSLTFSSKMVGISSNIALQRIYFSEALRLAALGETPGQLPYSKLY